MQLRIKFKLVSAVAALLLLTSEAFASDAWTTEEKTLEAAYLVLTVMDWKQTRYIADHPNSYFERNPFLNEHPSRREVDRFFIVTTGIHIIVVDALPHRWRVPVQWLTIAEKAYNVYRNHQIGIGFAF